MGLGRRHLQVTVRLSWHGRISKNESWLMFLLRVQLPEVPGALGAVATAMGAAGADIQALEIVGHGPGFAIDDFIVNLPPDSLPDTLVAACQTVEGVRVLWVSRSHTDWTIASDIEVLNSMGAHPESAGAILVNEAPNLFHSSWAALVEAGQHVVHATGTAPDFDENTWRAIGDLTRPRTLDLPANWIPEWGETIVAIAPINHDRVMLVGRQGGPAYLPSELTRLKHLAMLTTN